MILLDEYIFTLGPVMYVAYLGFWDFDVFSLLKNRIKLDLMV